MPLDILAFVRKWNASTLTERSAYQQHFRDLCEALDVPHPTQEDTDASTYTYEKRVAKIGGGQGFADDWKRGYFAWEYKSKGGDLKAAYKQLNEYHEALENPPLLVVSAFVRFEVHTKFENLPSRVCAFTLDDLLVLRDIPTSALSPSSSNPSSCSRSCAAGKPPNPRSSPPSPKKRAIVPPRKTLSS